MASGKRKNNNILSFYPLFHFFAFFLPSSFFSFRRNIGQKKRTLTCQACWLVAPPSIHYVNLRCKKSTIHLNQSSAVHPSSTIHQVKSPLQSIKNKNKKSTEALKRFHLSAFQETQLNYILDCSTHRAKNTKGSQNNSNSKFKLTTSSRNDQDFNLIHWNYILYNNSYLYCTCIVHPSILSRVDTNINTNTNISTTHYLI